MVSEGHVIEFEGTVLVVIADQIVVAVSPLVVLLIVILCARVGRGPTHTRIRVAIRCCCSYLRGRTFSRLCDKSLPFEVVVNGPTTGGSTQKVLIQRAKIYFLTLSLFLTLCFTIKVWNLKSKKVDRLVSETDKRQIHNCNAVQVYSG